MNENVFENCNTAINTATNTVLSTSRGWGAHKSQGDLPWATYRAVVRRQNPVVGLAVQSLKKLCSGYDAIDNAFYIAQARVSNMLRAQRRHVKIKMEVNASPSLSSLGSRFEIGLVYHGLYSAAVCPGVALGDLVIDLPSPRQLQTSSPTEQTSSITSQQPLSTGMTSASPQRLLNRELCDLSRYHRRHHLQEPRHLPLR
ncbi:hypothetical protein D6C81_09190 [Aureobasidium pullulans]|nr:hypothetical protein D6C81_09190 [Aureobasidium pullulans]